MVVTFGWQAEKSGRAAESGADAKIIAWRVFWLEEIGSLFRGKKFRATARFPFFRWQTAALGGERSDFSDLLWLLYMKYVGSQE